MTLNKLTSAIIFVFLTGLALTVFAQTTAFTYQGSLSSSGGAANGPHDFEFALFDSGGTQLGSTITQNGVAVTNGIFAVSLDFGSVFPGAARFLEIHVRTQGGGVFTTLSPRQPLTSTPYSVKSLSADNAVNAVTATSFTGTLNGDVTGTQGATTVARLQGRNVANTVPLNDQVLKFNTATNQWQPGTDSSSSGGGVTNVSATGPLASSGGATPNISLGLVPTANIADAAVTSAKIATGQVVKTLNGLTDNISLAQGSNITITPSGSTLTIASTSGGVGGSGTAAVIPLWNGVGTSTTLGNSLITQSGGGVLLPNNVSLAGGGSGGAVSFGTPSGESGMSIAGTNRADVRFDGTTLKLLAGTGPGAMASTNGINIDRLGNVGVGTDTPQNKFVVNAGGSGGLVNFGTPSGESGMAIIGTNRADVRFDGTTLKLLAGTGPGAMASTNGINVNRFGNVGIGTTSPGAKLAISGAGAFNATGAARFDIFNTTAGNGYLQNVTDSGAWQLASINSAATRLLIDQPGNVNVYGNVMQPIASNGLVKAMLFVDDPGTIIRCYNGITNTSTGNCGFSISHPLGGYYIIDFGFQVDNRFVSVTPQNSDGFINIGANFRNVSVNTVAVYTFITDVQYLNSNQSNPFMIIVY